MEHVYEDVNKDTKDKVRKSNYLKHSYITIFESIMDYVLE